MKKLMNILIVIIFILGGLMPLYANVATSTTYALSAVGFNNGGGTVAGAANYTNLTSVGFDPAGIGTTATYKNHIGFLWIDYPTPTMQITAPTISSDTDYDTNLQDIVIRGTVSYVQNNESVVIYVNGVANSWNKVNDGEWSGTVCLTGTGDSIMAKATDYFDTSRYDTITVHYFESPDVGLTSPSSDSVAVSLYYTTISGTTAQLNDGDTIKIYVDNVYVDSIIVRAVEEDWSCSVTLPFTGLADSVLLEVKYLDEYNRTGTGDTSDIWLYPPRWGDTDVVITEVMFDAPASIGDAGGHWIELYNTTLKDTDISGWYIKTSSGTQFTIPQNTVIGGHGFVVLAGDNFNDYYNDTSGCTIVFITGLRLTNGSDTLTLYKDATSPQKYADIMYYSGSFGSADKSLEAKNPTLTWGNHVQSDYDSNFDATTQDSGTPGLVNSTAIASYGLLTGHSAIMSTVVTDTIYGDTVGQINLSVFWGNGDTIPEGYGFEFTADTGFFTNKDGSADYGKTYSVLTNRNCTAVAYFSATVYGSDACTAVITAACTEAGGSMVITDTHQVVISTVSSVTMGYDSIYVHTIFSGADTYSMMCATTLSPNGDEMAYLAKQGSNSFGIYNVNVETGESITILNNDVFDTVENTTNLCWDNDEVLFSATTGGIQRIYSVKTDGSEKAETPSNLIYTPLQNYYNIMGIHKNSGEDSIVFIRGASKKLAHQDMLLFKYGPGAMQIAALTGWELLRDANDNYCTIIVQPRISPDGDRVAFIAMYWDQAIPAGQAGYMNKLKSSDVWILSNVNDIIESGFSGRITSWSDKRLTCVTNETDNFVWNPEWNGDGSSVGWSEDIEGNFDYRKYAQNGDDSGAEADPYNELNNADFNTYKRYIADTEHIDNYATQEVSTDSGNQLNINWVPGTDTMVTTNWDTNGNITIRVLREATEVVINKNGGLLFKNGRTILVVPKNETRAANTKIGATDIDAGAAPSGDSDPQKIILTGTARDYYPDGTTFSNTATMILYYTAAELDSAVSTINQKFGTSFTDGDEINNTFYERYLSVFWYNPVNESWEEYEGTVDPTDGIGYAGKIYVGISHFSVYGVGYATLYDPDSSTLESGASELTADGIDSALITVTLKSDRGDRINTEPIIINSSAGSTITYADGTTTDMYNGITRAYSDANGVVKAYVSGLFDSGTQDIISVNGINDTAALTYKGDADQYLKSAALQVIGNVQVGQTVTLRFTLTDQKNNPVTATNAVTGSANTAKLYVSGSLSGSISSATAEVKSGGTADFTLYSTVPGTLTFDSIVLTADESKPVTTSGSNWSGDAAVTISAGAPVKGGLSFSIDYTDVRDRGIDIENDAGTVTVTLKDAYNNVITDQEVVLTSLRGSKDTITPVSGTTDGSGQAVFNISSTYTGYTQVKLTTPDLNKYSKAIYFKALTPYADSSSLNIVSDTLTADGISYTTIEVTLKNRFGEAVPEEYVVLSSDKGSISPMLTSYTNSGGYCEFKLTAGTITGVSEVSLTTPSLPLTDSIELVAGQVTNAGCTFTLLADAAAEGDGTDSIAVGVTLTDDYGNPYKNKEVIFVSKRGAIDTIEMDTTVSGGAAVTNSSGYAVGYIKSTTAGTTAVTLEVPGTVSKYSDDLYLSPTAPYDENSSLTIAEESVSAGNQVKAVVQLKDATGDAVLGVTVSLSASMSGAVISPSSLVSNNNGYCTFGVYSEEAGTMYVYITTPEGMSRSDMVIYTPLEPDQSKSSISLSSTGLTADGTSKTTITVILKDKYGNAVPDRTVDLDLISGRAGDILTDPAAVTDNNGKTEGYLSSTTAGSVKVKTVSPVELTSDNITFSAGSPETGTISLAASAVAAENVPIVITLKDGTGNNVPDYDVTLYIMNKSNEQVQSVSLTTDANGSCTANITSTLAVTYAVTTELIGGTFKLTGEVEFLPGEISSFTADMAVSVQVGSDTVTVSVTAKDVYGNVIKTFSDTDNIELLSDNCKVSIVDKGSFENGTSDITAVLTSYDIEEYCKMIVIYKSSPIGLTRFDIVDTLKPVISSVNIQGEALIPGYISVKDKSVTLYGIVKDNSRLTRTDITADLYQITGTSGDIPAALYDEQNCTAYWTITDISKVTEGLKQITIKAKDAYGNKTEYYKSVHVIAALESKDTQTIVDSGLVEPILSGDGKARLMIEPGILSESAKQYEKLIFSIEHDSIKEFFKSRVAEAYNATVNPGDIDDIYYEYNCYGVNGNESATINSTFIAPGKHVTIGLQYPASMEASQAQDLNIMVLARDSETKRWYWEPLDKEVHFEHGSNWIQVEVEHFSIYGLVFKTVTSMKELQVYPNPWTSNTPTASKDENSVSYGIKFRNILPGSTIKIYNVAGELVRELQVTNSSLTNWNLRNDSGEKVASGVYLYIINSSEGVKTGKISIIK